ncbi:MAG: FAD-dependent oxidoreductase [Pseudomonadota bacterium]
MSGDKISVEVVGSGVLGLCAAEAFLSRGARVTVISASDGCDASCCSWWAGGMLAPGCEMETAEPLIGALGAESVAHWARAAQPAPTFAGSLVVAPARDRPEFERFARRTNGWARLGEHQIADLEPDLAGRYRSALYFADEGHLDPRRVLASLRRRLQESGVRFKTGHVLTADARAAPPDADWRIDCRGLAARDALPDLRGVRGEMVLVRTHELRFRRPIRLLHPRTPLYVVPRGDGVFMVGATMIESETRGGPSLRSVLELTAAAHALHPAFGEAEIVEIGADVRPAFPDNLPRLRRRGRTLWINGAYRHGFLLGPALARRAADMLYDDSVDADVCDENTP